MSSPNQSPTTSVSSRVAVREQLLVQIDAGIKRALKVAAVKRGVSLRDVVEEASREWLDRHEKEPKS